MTLAYALELFNLERLSTNEEALKQFRILVKKYHPDNNRDTIEFSNIMMKKINEAYEIILKSNDTRAKKHDSHDASPPHDRRQSKDTSDINREARSQTQTQQTEIKQRGYYEEHPLLLDKKYHQHIHTFTECICHYYHYDLQNINARARGTFRHHYTLVINKLTNIVALFKDSIAKYHDQAQDIQNYYCFIESFYKNAALNTATHIATTAPQVKLNKIYRACILTIDTSIMRWHCLNEQERFYKSISYDQLILSQNNLIHLLEESSLRYLAQTINTKIVLINAFFATLYWKIG